MGHLLAPTLFSKLIIKIQQEELRLANISNFEQCKYCTFGTSMSRFLSLHSDASYEEYENILKILLSPLVIVFFFLPPY
jgi:hypothetical protein